MKANEFVKKYGWGKVKVLISECADNYTHVTNDARMFINEKRYKEFAPHFHESLNDTVRFSDLKRLVESWELVEKYDSLGDAKSHLNRIEFRISTKTWFGRELINWSMYRDKLKQAIADVESCQ